MATSNRPDRFREECGVFGIYDHEHAARLTFLGLYALQHRGQESAGIVSSDGRQMSYVRGMGYVSDIFDEECFARLPGRMAIGHVRYSTAGEVSLREAQPFLVDYHSGQMALCHNGNFPNAQAVRSELEKEGSIFQSTSDTEIVLHLMARVQATDVVEALVQAVGRMEGAYSILFATPEIMVAARDPRGFRPLSIGVLNGSYVVASESCAFDLIGACFLRDILPGEVVVFSADGMKSLRPFAPQPIKQCIFEHVYFSRPDSVVFGQPVSLSRQMLGRFLARNAPADADVIVPVPDSGVAAAIGYSLESGIPFCFGLVRNHYVGRTFIEPKASIRHFRVKVKLNPVRQLLEGKRVVLVDDSIVRGTTSQEIVQMVRAAGAAEVLFRVSCPPTISPCYYGVDTPNREELIAYRLSIDQIRDFIGADSLGYLSRDALLEACADPGDQHFCTSCYTGEYPTPIGPESRFRCRVPTEMAGINLK
ncbi:MAG: amidophosphoribosyltransferase [Acidobacteria bacterium]|nr:amidophosphoribosyltransferase [Acidobacteriota bacterium]